MFFEESTFFRFNGTFIGALRAIDMLLWENFVLSTIKWFLFFIYSSYVYILLITKKMTLDNLSCSMVFYIFYLNIDD